MAERKKLSADVMKAFVKNPEASDDKKANEPTIQQGSQETSSLTDSVLARFKGAESEPTTRLTVDLPKSMHKRFKGIAQDLDTDMSSLLRVLIEKFVEEAEGR